MSVCKQTPKKNVQLVNCPSENTAFIQMHPYRDGELFFKDNHQEATGHLMKLAGILIALN